MNAQVNGQPGPDDTEPDHAADTPTPEVNTTTDPTAGDPTIPNETTGDDQDVNQP